MIFNLLCFAGPKPEKEYINVSGEATIEVMPDYAEIGIGVTSLQLNSDSAMIETEKGVNSLFEVCKKHNITEIETMEFNIERKFSHEMDKKGEFIGFEVTSSYNLKITNLNNINNFLSECYKIGTNHIKWVSFKIEKQDSLKRIASGLAMEDANKNAIALIKTTKRNLGKLINASYNKPEDFDFIPRVGFGNEFQYGSGFGGGAAGGVGDYAFFKVIPRKVKITSKVYVIYALQ
jgi:uncharacterized protein YggE